MSISSSELGYSVVIQLSSDFTGPLNLSLVSVILGELLTILFGKLEAFSTSSLMTSSLIGSSEVLSCWAPECRVWVCPQFPRGAAGFRFPFVIKLIGLLLFLEQQ